MGDMTAAHIIFIPGVLIIGIVIGWVLGARAAQDAYAAELRRRDERSARRDLTSQPSNPDSPRSPTSNPRGESGGP